MVKSTHVAIVEICCQHMGYSFQLEASVLLYMHHPSYKIGHTTAFVTLVIKPLVRISMYVCVYSVLFVYLLSFYLP